MGVFEGGLLMTVLFFTIIGFLAIGGSLDKNPGAFTYLASVSNDGNILDYSNNPDLNLNTFTTNSDTGATVSTTPNQNPAGSCESGDILKCGDALARLKTYFSIIAEGWVLILTILLGGTPLSPLIYLIGIPLQILQVVFIVQILFLIVSIFTGGGAKI